MTDSEQTYDEQIGYSREVTPPKPILILIDGRWWPGQLDRWSREPDSWYGRATLDHGSATSWYPARTLRSRNPDQVRAHRRADLDDGSERSENP